MSNPIKTNGIIFGFASSCRTIFGFTILAIAIYVVVFCFSLLRHLSGMPCIGNLKQLGLCLSQYEQDYDGRLPSAGRWHDATYPYARWESVFHCPLAAGTPYGYAMNQALSSVDGSYIDTPSRTFVLFESDSKSRNATGSAGIVAWTRHSDSANYAYCDGHVTSITASMAQAGKNDEGKPIWWTAHRRW